MSRTPLPRPDPRRRGSLLRNNTSLSRFYVSVSLRRSAGVHSTRLPSGSPVFVCRFDLLPRLGPGVSDPFPPETLVPRPLELQTSLLSPPSIPPQGGVDVVERSLTVDKIFRYQLDLLVSDDFRSFENWTSRWHLLPVYVMHGPDRTEGRVGRR